MFYLIRTSICLTKKENLKFFMDFKPSKFIVTQQHVYFDRIFTFAYTLKSKTLFLWTNNVN